MRFRRRPPPWSISECSTVRCVSTPRRTHLASAGASGRCRAKLASSELLRTLEAHAQRMVAALGRASSIEARVTRTIAAELRGGEPSLSRVARQLAMSPRTLQRQLEAEHTSFAEVLDRTRRDFADIYVRDRQLALTEVAFLLGFSEASAFTRAFQRWYGVAPSQFRARGTAA